MDDDTPDDYLDTTLCAVDGVRVDDGLSIVKRKNWEDDNGECVNVGDVYTGDMLNDVGGGVGGGPSRWTRLR